MSFQTKIVSERRAYNKIKDIVVAGLKEPCQSKRRLYKRSLIMISAICEIIRQEEENNAN